MDFIFLNSANLVKLNDLVLASDGSYINDAVVTYQLLDSSNSVVTSGTLSNIDDEGNYSGSMSASLTEFAHYTIAVSATYAGKTTVIYDEVIAVKDQGSNCDD